MTVREVEHEITVLAPPAEVYRFIAEVENWPLIFPPTVHVEYAERGERTERIQIWATVNGSARNWTSRRELDPGALRIRFRAEVPAPPVAAMGGTWLLEPAGDGACRVRLLHDYRAVDDDPDNLAWIDAAVDRNSKSELGALKANVELATGAAELLLDFTDELRIDGRAKDVYDFIDQAGEWRDRLPHVKSVDLEEVSPGLQILAMETITKDGGSHTTKSVRVCFPDSSIVYKQIETPALMTLHTGRWTFTEDGDGTLATSRHTVVINPDNIERILGPDATVADAKDFVRAALGGNSLATLGHAKRYAEALRS
ncbi:aromatase/cyclase [Actinomadura rayongensis]|uniref:Cyclase n=1 Tax=Actinomadura rayongensis TaxID=1429076 RepID=A0A6I4W8F4_9ACTN|nr:aromatase/cyclase [Actinomadura rayongensis]MXQ63022.1 cyclase [Actinomadura rayongensis]